MTIIWRYERKPNSKLRDVSECPICICGGGTEKEIRGRLHEVVDCSKCSHWNRRRNSCYERAQRGLPECAMR